MAPLEPWEKVLVSEEFLQSTHGGAACSDCHGGTQSEDKDTAHTGLIADPTVGDQNVCAGCHSDVVAASETGLHFTQAGYWTNIDTRSVPENHPQLEEMFGNHCASCHTTCGDCHISQPNSVGGGFLDGHVVEQTPPMTRTCTACHGSRVGAEFLGHNEGIAGDVHFRQERMNCTSCHDAANMHASEGDAAAHRYAGEQTPQCENCHPQVGAADDTVMQHALHKDTLSCQVCHAVEYTSCDNCHVAVSETTGNPYYTTDASYLGFYIGRNPRQDENRPYAYVLVRHIPVTPDSFSYYGEDLLPNFDSLETWAYTTPHNIQRVTPQNQSCGSCHGNAELFLTADKVAPEELEANQDVIVPNPPAAMGN